MTFIQNIDPLKVMIKKSFLYGEETEDLEEGYLIAVKSIQNRCLMFTVHLISGALFSHVPITEIYCLKYGPYDPLCGELSDQQPFSCLDGDIQVIKYSHLKDCKVLTKRIGYGHYLFTVDYLGQGLSEDPEQYKSHNVIVVDGGALVALPNNYCLFLDGFFTENKEEKFPPYIRQEKYYTGPA